MSKLAALFVETAAITRNLERFPGFCEAKTYLTYSLLFVPSGSVDLHHTDWRSLLSLLDSPSQLLMHVSFTLPKVLLQDSTPVLLQCMSPSCFL